MSNNTNKNYDSLRKKIISYVPEIVELKFGCKLRIDYRDIKSEYIFVCKSSNFYTFENDDYSTICLEVNSEFEIINIIGRDITLEDILVALIQSIKNLEQFAIRLSGDKDYIIIKCYDRSNIYWTPNKPLQDQSPETIKSLDNLIE